MSDWPKSLANVEKRILSTGGIESCLGRLGAGSAANNFSGNQAWPAANRAFYCPVELQYWATVYQMSWNVATQGAGPPNYDIGIYDEAGARIVNLGTTAVPAAGLALANIADTLLAPGLYFLALLISSTATFPLRGSQGGVGLFATCGVQQQDVGSTTLPATATFANPGNALCPLINAHLQATV